MAQMHCIVGVFHVTALGDDISMNHGTDTFIVLLGCFKSLLGCFKSFIALLGCFKSHMSRASTYTPHPRGGGLGSRPIFKKFNEPYAPS